MGLPDHWMNFDFFQVTLLFSRFTKLNELQVFNFYPFLNYKNDIYLWLAYSTNLCLRIPMSIRIRIYSLGVKICLTFIILTNRSQWLCKCSFDFLYVNILHNLIPNHNY